MQNTSTHKAYLPNFSGEHLQPISLNVDSRFQFAVTCGAQSAIAFFSEDQAITLHAHLPRAVQLFTNHARLSAASLGVAYADYAKACTDAFVAGYLGRIQQELRIMHTTKGEAETMVSHASNNTVFNQVH